MSTESLQTLLDRNDIAGMQHWISERRPYEIADEIGRQDAVEAVLLFRLLSKDEAIEVFEELDPIAQQKILDGLRDHAFRELVEAMDPDDRVRLLGEAPAKVAQRVLAGLSQRERDTTAELLGYPEGSVGRYMSPEVVIVRHELTAGQALDVVRGKGLSAETVYTLPVVDDERRLVSVVSLRDLVLSAPGRPLQELLGEEPVAATATDDAEQAARLMRESNLLALPVVDSEQRVVGLLTIDDAMEVLESAETEDFVRQSATTPWQGHYVAASVFQIARSRIAWLLLLLVAATLTVNVMQFFEATLAEVTALALFIPLLTGTGGNAGAQAATATVRALAVGQLRTGDVLRVVWRECRVGVLLGVMLATVGLVIGTLLVGFQVTLTVALSIVVICTWAAMVGAAMPLLAKRVGIDPAVVSAPLVTTLVDATGLIIYFLMAHLVLGV
ncbi:magnesium transporter [Salinifilum aidingensis]